MESGHGRNGNQSGDRRGAGPEYFGGRRAAPRGPHELGDQPQAGDTQKLRQLHPADSREKRLLAARGGNRAVPLGPEDSQPRRRRAVESGYSRRGFAFYEVARRENSPHAAPRGIGSGRSGLRRKSGGARILQGKYVGGPPDVFTFHERRKMPACLAPEA